MLSYLFCALSALALPLTSALQQEPLTRQPLEKYRSLTHDLIAFHKNLTQIESVSGNEHNVGQWLVSSLKSQGYAIEKQHVGEHRFNILAWPGATRDAQVLLSSHLDTVPPFIPYGIVENKHNTTITGRGCVDDKGSVAAQVLAVNALLVHGKISPNDVALLFVVDEEVGGDGMRAANALHLKPKTIIFGEPTEGKLAAGHKGNLGFNIRAKGKAAHSGYPWLGRSANEVMVASLMALMKLDGHLPKSDKYGSTTINIGRVEGGVAANVVAEKATASIAVRLAGGSPADVKKEITNAIYTATAAFQSDGEDPSDVVELEWSSAGYGPIDIDHDVPGFDTITVNYGTDIPWLDRTVKEQKRYLYGPGSILVAHSDHEALTTHELEDAVQGYVKLVLHALGE